MALLTLLSQVAFTLAMTFRPGDFHRQLAETAAGQWPFWLGLLYLPALLMVLRNRSDGLTVSSPPKAPR